MCHLMLYVSVWKTCSLLIKQLHFTVNIYFLSVFVLFCVVLLLSHSLIHSNIQHQMSTILFSFSNWIYWRQRKNTQQWCSYICYFSHLWFSLLQSRIPRYGVCGFLPHYYSANRVEWSVSVLKWLPHTLLCLVFSGGLAGKKNLELILVYIIFNFMMIEVKFSSARPKTAVSVIIWVRRSRCLLHFLGLLGQRF